MGPQFVFNQVQLRLFAAQTVTASFKRFGGFLLASYAQIPSISSPNEQAGTIYFAEDRPFQRTLVTSWIGLKLALPNISEWKAEQIRIVLFSDSSWSTASDVIYQEIFGLDPLEITEKRATGESNASGSNEDGQVSIIRTINRLDVVLQAAPGDTVFPALISNIDVRLQRLLAAISSWVLTQNQSIVRVAVNGRMLLQTESVEESYSKLKEYIQVVQIDADRFRDFQFQVNLRKQSNSVAGLQINRLTSWASLVVGVGLMQPGLSMQQGLERHYCNCSTDINSDREYTSPFSPSEVAALLREMCDETTAILVSGIS